MSNYDCRVQGGGREGGRRVVGGEGVVGEEKLWLEGIRDHG